MILSRLRARDEAEYFLKFAMLIIKNNPREGKGGTPVGSSAEKQAMILKYVTERICEGGYPPSIREIGAAVGLSSPSTVHTYLHALVDAGKLRMDPDKKRSLSLPEEYAMGSVSVPVLGRVTAGQPVLAVEDIEGYVPMAKDKARGRELFALRVDGLSMKNAGILDGDIVVCEKRPDARDGEIVVALIEDEATVKRFFKEKGRFRLQPENEDFEPIYAEELLILGKVVALVRNYL